MKHTPTMKVYQGATNADNKAILYRPGETIFAIIKASPKDMAFTIQAINNHEALLKACKKARELIKHDYFPNGEKICEKLGLNKTLQQIESEK